MNFVYDDIVHALQNTIDSCINSAADRHGYLLECRFNKFSEIMQCNEWRRNIAKYFNRLSRVHERYRQTTDRRTGDDI